MRFKSSHKGGDFFIYIKYKKEVVIEDLEEKGFKIIEYKNNSNIIAYDKNNYKYKLNYLNILYGKKPSMLMRNPFALQNFKLYLSEKYPHYELLDNEYKSCKTKMRFICHKHEDKGIQLNTPDNILNNGHVCRYCGYSQMGKERQIDENRIIKRCNELSLEYVSRTSRDGESYILFICQKHRNRGIQGMSWTHFKECTNGCVYCSSSIGENIIRNELNQFGISFEEQKIFDGCKYIKPLRFDFYIPEFNLAIEYDGQQHFEPVNFSGKGMEYASKIFDETKKRDEIKNNFCVENNIRLLRIPYTENKHIHTILENNLMIEKCNI